jgi:hypothetical protein
LTLSTAHKAILLLVAAGIVIGAGIGFLNGLSQWGILAGVVLGAVGAAAGASTLVGYLPIGEEINWPKEKEARPGDR